MGTSILKGITTGLLVTVLTLLAVLGTTLAGIDKTIISYIVDFGLLLSCLAAGYRASRNSGRILPSGLASGGYAIVGVLLLALYFPIDTLGAVKIISEGTGLGLLAGVLGAGILSSGPDFYDYMDVPDYSKRENYYDRKNTYELMRDDPWDKNRPASIHRRYSDISKSVIDMTPYPNSQEPYQKDHESERAKIYEICSPQKARTEKMEEDDAFNWWRVEAQRQLKSR